MAVAARSPRQQGAMAEMRADNVLPLARLQRSAGRARVAFKRRDGRTVLEDVHQSGCCKLRFPRALPGALPEAVLVNTAGGLTDGDRIETHALWRAGTAAAVTTQAAERIYRSRGGPARVANRLHVEEGATAYWLPQEAILFDGGRLERRLDAEIAEGGGLLACESTVFGRRAMGETVEHGRLLDVWRVRHAGALVFADGLGLAGNIQAALARPALAGGAAAVASVIYVGDRAEAMREPLRDVLGRCACVAGCSVIGPVLVVRMLGMSGGALRRDLVNVLHAVPRLLGVRGPGERMTAAGLPRVWSC